MITASMGSNYLLYSLKVTESQLTTDMPSEETSYFRNVSGNKHKDREKSTENNKK